MSLTKIGSIGINTGIQFAGVTTVSTLKVGTGVTLSSDGDIFATGVTTATSFVGDGSGLTGVASTENIRTNTNATFLQNINVSGSTTTGSLVSSGAVSGTTGTFSGAVSGTTGNFSSNVDVAGELTVAETIAHTGDTNNKISFPSADTITLTTAGSERLRITSAGTVGINQASPDSNSTLDVMSDLTGTTVNSNRVALFRTNGGGRDAHITLSNSSNTPVHIGQLASDLYFTTNNTETLRIASDSNITQTIDTDGDGFIITAGDMKPMLTGNSNRSAENNTIFGIVGKWNNTEVGRIAFEAGADTTNKDDGRIRFYTRESGGSLTQRMIITDEGRVGIKETAPDATLHVGGVIDSHPVLLLQGGSGSTGDIAIPHDENLQAGHWNSSTNTYTNRFQINNTTGNITMPSQACMVFVNPANITTVSNANGNNLDPIHFSTQHINNGSMTSSNTKSRITVPTAGVYMINALLSGSLSNASTGDGIQIKILRNGSVYPNNDMWPAEGMGESNGEEYAFTFNFPCTLAANDYVELVFDNIGGTIQFDLQYGYFAVSLMY